MHFVLVLMMGLEELAWMSGHWRGDAEKTQMEEYWTVPKQGTMIGLHRDVTGDKVQFEFLRIVKEDDQIIYYASPGGRHPATPFRLVEVKPGRAVFANPAHDFPQRIIYWKNGRRLCARVEDEKGEGEQWCWRGP